MALSIGWVDWTLAGRAGGVGARRLVRGLVFEVLSLAGWVAAYFAAQWLAPPLARRTLPVGASRARR